MSSRLRAHSWQAALPKPLPAEQGFDASEARLTRVRWVKGGFRGLAPQASAIPGFATARLWKYISHFSTTSCARTSTSWNHFRKAPERPGVTKPLPGTYKLVENIRQTCEGPQFGRRAIGLATTTLPAHPVGVGG